MEENKQTFVIEIANCLIRCSCMFEDTASFFDRYIRNNKVEDNTCVMIDEYDKELWAGTGNKLNAYGEYSLLCGGVSDYMMSYNNCLIHAVAFSFKDRAYLILAAPGTGKSTQIKYLMDMYPDQFSVICGDRPCLSFEEDGKILVYPTPWNGKENWYGAEACELAGVFYLLRGEITSITRLSQKGAIVPVFASIISRRETDEIIHAISHFTEIIINKYPVYKYVNGGVPDSTVKFYDTILNEVTDHEV